MDEYYHILSKNIPEEKAISLLEQFKLASTIEKDLNHCGRASNLLQPRRVQINIRKWASRDDHHHVRASIRNSCLQRCQTCFPKDEYLVCHQVVAWLSPDIGGGTADHRRVALILLWACFSHHLWQAWSRCQRCLLSHGYLFLEKKRRRVYF